MARTTLRALQLGAVAVALALARAPVALAQAYPNGGEGSGTGPDGGPGSDVLGRTVFPSPSDGPGGGLAFTGGQILLLVALAAFLIAAGGLLARQARRRGLTWESVMGQRR